MIKSNDGHHISAIFRKRDESDLTKSSAWMNFWGFDEIQVIMFRTDE